MVADDDHRNGRIERGHVVERGGDDVRQANAADEEEKRHCDAADARIEENVAEGEVRRSPAHDPDAVCPDENLEDAYDDRAAEDAVRPEEGVLERKRHEAGVGEDRREAQSGLP